MLIFYDVDVEISKFKEKESVNLIDYLLYWQKIEKKKYIDEAVDVDTIENRLNKIRKLKINEKGSNNVKIIKQSEDIQKWVF